MARACSVCSHPDHLDIDASLLGAGRERLSQRDVARLYGLSRASVQRHAADHVAPIMRAVADQVTRLHGETLLVELGGLYERTIRLLDKAEQSGDLRTAVSAVREARGAVETFAKVGLALSAQGPEPEALRTDLDDRIDAALRARMDDETPALVAGHDSDAEVVEGVIVDE